ncbi:MAG: iron-containing alcohol dehydrogenase [Verrucomicrobia bacterium]|nr:iron-containing alcohol dehydrogenase [Verrucomicrobiota bacterium]
MNFEFATVTRIIFGPGTLQEAGSVAKALGKRALVVTGRTAQRAKPLLAVLRAAGMKCATLPVAGEPTTVAVREGTQRARDGRCDVIIGFGGGSALDAAKAIAALLTNGGDLLDYLEVIGRGKPLTVPSAPCVTIPTTAGSGTEVTRNAVIGSPQHRVKVSLRSSLMLPRVAIVDPTLTHRLPRQVTANSGLDALSQLIEPFVSVKANPMTDALCRAGMTRVARSLRRACEDGGDAAAREDMSLASLFGGLALANAGLGAVHGFAAPLGGRFPAPHGAVCARLLPRVMEVNIRALRGRRPGCETLRRYDEVAQLLTGNPCATADDGVAWVGELCEKLEIGPLRAYGVKPGHFAALVERAAAASSMKSNPILLSQSELREILARSL